MLNKINVVDVDVVQVDLPVEAKQPVDVPVEPSEKVIMKPPKTSRSSRVKKAAEPTLDPVKEETTAIVVKEEPVEEVIVKKPKTSRTKKVADPVKETEVVKESEPVKEAEPVQEQKNIKTVELVECPKCGKKITQRTLNYSHMAVCPANENRSAKKTNVRTVGGSESEYGKYLDEGSKPMESAKLQRLSRTQLRREKYQHLISNAF